jgi:hypothetical protein
MRYVEKQDALVAWIKVCVGVSLVLMLVIETLLCLMYSLIIKQDISIYSKFIQYASLILVGDTSI